MFSFGEHFAAEAGPKSGPTPEFDNPQPVALDQSLERGVLRIRGLVFF
jgi:hypothetical protein